MVNPLFRTFLGVLEAVRPSLRRRAFARWVTVTVGWILTVDPRHSLAAALVAAGVATAEHFQNWYDWFARGSWDTDSLGLAILRRVRSAFPDQPLHLVVDDSLNPHKGPHIFGLGCHIDPVLSSRAHKILRFGLCWVVLSVVVRVPFSKRFWALPILFRLYRNRKDCEAHGGPYAKKTELARAMIDVVCRAFRDVPILGSGDVAYCNRTVLRDRPSNLHWVGAMHPRAALTATPAPGGRRKRGERLPNPTELAGDRRRRWKHAPAHLYGRTERVAYKALRAQWYSVCGAAEVALVVVRTVAGAVPFRVFFSTDPSLDAVGLVEAYARRWPIEVFFAESRAWLGWGESAQRVEAAVLRMTPFVGWIYTLLVVWFAEGAWQQGGAYVPTRPWYNDKEGLCFADIVRTAREVLRGVDIVRELRVYDKLGRWQSAADNDPQLTLPLVA